MRDRCQRDAYPNEGLSLGVRRQRAVRRVRVQDDAAGHRPRVLHAERPGGGRDAADPPSGRTWSPE